MYDKTHRTTSEHGRATQHGRGLSRETRIFVLMADGSRSRRSMWRRVSGSDLLLFKEKRDGLSLSFPPSRCVNFSSVPFVVSKNSKHESPESTTFSRF